MILRFLRWLDVHLTHSPQCEQCGCTNHFACPNRCAWLLSGWPGEETVLCSNCWADTP